MITELLEVSFVNNICLMEDIFGILQVILIGLIIESELILHYSWPRFMFHIHICVRTRSSVRTQTYLFEINLCMYIILIICVSKSHCNR